jgi:hypothetical protein
MKKILIILIPCISLLFISCRKEKRLERHLDGKWKISHFENLKIFNDGNIQVIADAENVGYFEFLLDEQKLTYFNFSYTINGSTQSGTFQYYGIDDHAKRIIIPDSYTPIGKDISYNIEENKRKHQVWTTYELHQQGLPTDFVYKLKLELDKE